MANIASATVTVHGKVSDRVVSLTANGSPVVLSGTSFAHTLAVTADRLVILTTIDDVGRSTSRTVRIESATVPHIAAVPG